MGLWDDHPIGLWDATLWVYGMSPYGTMGCHPMGLWDATLWAVTLWDVTLWGYGLSPYGM